MARIVKADQDGPRIIAKAVVDAKEQARAILARAQNAAEATLARAVEEGRLQARAELAGEWLKLTEERQRLVATTEAQAVEIAILAAKRIVGEELVQRPELIGNTVRTLLLRVRRATQVTLRVHPDDRSALTDLLQSWAAHDKLPDSLRIEDDVAQSRGGCLLISDVGTLDARVDTQLQALANALGAK